MAGRIPVWSGAEEQQLWDTLNELSALMQAASVDLVKNLRGNAASGVRLRSRLRSIKHVAAALIKSTSERDKRRRTDRRLRRKKTGVA